MIPNLGCMSIFSFTLSVNLIIMIKRHLKRKTFSTTCAFDNFDCV